MALINTLPELQRNLEEIQVGTISIKLAPIGIRAAAPWTQGSRRSVPQAQKGLKTPLNMPVKSKHKNMNK